MGVGYNPPPGREIAQTSSRQHGNITRSQLLALGVTDDSIAARIAAGELHRVHRGVYAVGRPPVVPLEWAAAAVLACGPHAVLSHGSALALWDLGRQWRPWHVTVTNGDRRPPGITVHRCHTLSRRDVTVQRGIRVTSAARAILDCAPTLTSPSRAVNAARHARLTTPAQIAELAGRNPTHPGAKILQSLVATGHGPTRSDFEDLFGPFCARYGLPTPVFNTIVGGYEVDAYFPQQGLIVELDSWEFHQDRSVFESDRERDAAHLAQGLPTVRITWERLKQTPAREARRLDQILTSIVTRSL